jgi:hypothetical protein
MSREESANTVVHPQRHRKSAQLLAAGWPIEIWNRVRHSDGCTRMAAIEIHHLSKYAVNAPNNTISQETLPRYTAIHALRFM